METDMLGEKIDEHHSTVWLVNTGWTGGAYGVGSRMSLAHTRAIVDAILNGGLDKATFETDPIFGLSIPTSCPGVPSEVLNPKKTWANGAEYDEKAQKLKGMFEDNFRKMSAGEASSAEG